MSWSKDYKRSIDCSNPKGFSQRAHCAARRKRVKGEYTKSKSPFNEMMEHCGCEDDAVQELESALKKLKNTSYDSIDHLMHRIMKKHDMTAKQLHNAFVDKHHKTPDDWINEGTLHYWFHGSKSKEGKPGWVQADGSPCANEPGETKTPKCFSSARLSALKRKGKRGESLIRSAVRRKRQKDKTQQQKSGAAKPTNVPTFAKGKKDKNYIKAEPGIKEHMELNEAQKDKPGKGSGKKDACYNKVKSRYRVWPSAYASGALVKCRKVGADNWGTKSEDCWEKGVKKKNKKMVPNCVPVKEESGMRYCPKCKKNENRDACKYGPKFWDMYSIPVRLAKYDANKPHPGNFPESVNIEDANGNHYVEFIDIIKPQPLKPSKGIGSRFLEEGLSFEISSKKTTGFGALTKSGAEQLGHIAIKKRQEKASDVDVPRFSPGSMAKIADSYIPNRKSFNQFVIEASAAWQRKEGKNPTGGLNKKGISSYRKEHPGSHLSLAVTTKPSKLKPGSKSANRRKSFCSRMKGMKAKLTSAKTAHDPNSRINKSLRKWNC